MTLEGDTTGGTAVMPAGLLLHLDASAVTGVNNGQAVVQWDDQSPNANHATQGTAGNRATYVASDAAINKMPALSFDGSNDQYQYATLAARTVFFVAKADSSATHLDGILGKSGADDGIRRNGDGAWQHPGDGNDFTNPGGSAFYINGAAGNAVGENVWHIAEAYRGGGAMNFDKIGQYYGGRDFPGDIAEVLIFGGVLSETDRQNVGGYLELKYGFDTPYTGFLGSSPVTTDLSGTTLAAAESSTVAISGVAEFVVIGGVEASASKTLTIGSDAPNMQLTNLTLGADSMVKSTLAATADVDVTVSGTLNAGGGKSYLGDPGDEFGAGADTFFTNLSLADGDPAIPNPVFNWTFASAAETDVDGGGMMVAIDDSVHVYGALEMGDGLTIQLVDGGGSSTAGVDVALFGVMDGATIDSVAPDVAGQWTPADLDKITILSPAGAPQPWTWDSLEFVNDEYVVLTNLVTGAVVGPHPGDATGAGGVPDGVVDELDLALFNAQLGVRAGGQACDFDDDGDVDLDDFAILRTEWGWGLPTAPEFPASETPEPATISLLALGGLMILRRRKSV